ncbi:hypothetical protein SAMN06269185_2448 [Natronoarchaeum philippinense]|uniref:Uncharacterized protein n=1 Tax=Natronoarchaeum philippinense TaxID=558529 RepID=A0A285P0N7_NATPI|nr:DUF6735 family protein [Natronoarchaeum philippinense]SNZ15285.1 hypothetical protein SAMN06269185_2448 [Natronoarchaeum philippinense]
MGHRALIAYERCDELYNLHYSHWGALNLQLKHDVDDETPFGGTEAHTEWAAEIFEQSCEQDALDTLLQGEERPRTTVDPDPEATGLTKEEIIAQHLDFEYHEAFYVVTTEFDITAYRTLWFGLQNVCKGVSDGPKFGNGALQTVRWYDGEPVGDGPLRGRFEALKDVVGDLIDDDVLTHEVATEYMIEKLTAWCGEEQELIVRTSS